MLFLPDSTGIRMSLLDLMPCRPLTGNVCRCQRESAPPSDFRSKILITNRPIRATDKFIVFGRRTLISGVAGTSVRADLG